MERIYSIGIPIGDGSHDWKHVGIEGNIRSARMYAAAKFPGVDGLVVMKAIPKSKRIRKNSIRSR
jgi:hypothetical protein